MSIDVNFNFKTIAGESITGEGDISIPPAEIKIDVTPVIDGSDGRLLLSSGSKVKQSTDIHTDGYKLGIGYSGTDYLGSQLDIKSLGALSSDLGIRLKDAMNWFDLFKVDGVGNLTMQPSVNQRPVHRFGGTSRVDLHLSSSFADDYSYSKAVDTFRDWGMSGFSLRNALTFYKSTGPDGSHWSNNMNFVCNKSDYHSGETRGRNGFFWYNPSMSTTIENVQENSLTSYLSYEKTYQLFDTEVVGDVFESQIDNSFLMFSRKVGGYSVPHFQTESGDVIKFYKQDWSGVSDVAGVISRLQELGL